MIFMNEPILFNGNDIVQVPGWRTTSTDTYRYPTRNLTSYALAYDNKAVTTSGFYTSKPLNIAGVLTTGSRELLDDSITELRRILEPINKTLRLPISDGQREYRNVSVSNMAISNVAGGYAEINIEFQTTDFYSYDLVETTVLDVVNLTSGNKSYPVVFDASAPQAPIIEYTVDSATSAINREVTFLNPSTGVSITVQRTWTANEVLVIDCENKTVEVDGDAVVFTGNFPEWHRGNQFINYTDAFVERQVDILVRYTKRYL
jgi:hypothetical protein